MRRTELTLLLLCALVAALGVLPCYAATQHAVLIMGEPYNLAHNTEYEAAWYRNILFQVGWTGGSPRGSLRDFFRENSYWDYYAANPALGLDGLDIDGRVWGWYTFYDVVNNDDPDENSVEWFNGILAGGAYGQPRLGDFMNKCIAAAQNDPMVPLDGATMAAADCFIFVHPGISFSSAPAFAMGNIIVARQEMGTMVFTHEMGHVQGLPDLYDYGGADPGARGVGSYDLMCQNNCQIGPSGKVDSLGYVRPIDLRVVGGQITVNVPTSPVDYADRVTISPDGHTAEVRIRPYEIYPDVIKFPAGGADYFHVFNRQRIGFDSNLPGAGVQIWHVDPTVGDNENEWWPEIAGPTETPHLHAAVEQADGLWEIEKGGRSGDEGDYYGYSSATSKFTSETRPASRGYGQTKSVLDIVDMQQDGNDYTIFFTVPTHNITGRVVDGGGAGVSGVKLTAVGTGGTFEAYSGPSGDYAFTSMFDDNYTVTPTLGGYSFAAASLPATMAGADVALADFVATQRTFGLTVTITSSGSPLQDVVVTIPGFTGTQPLPTDAAGTTTAAGFVAGSYFVVPSLAGYAFTPTQQMVTFPTAPDPPGDATVTFTASTISSISGTVSDSGNGLGIEGALVTAAPGGETATTREDGTYALPFMPADTHTLTVTKDEYTFSAPLVVTVPASAVNQDFTGSRNQYTVSGTVTTSGGAGLAGVVVTAGGRTATTNGAGAYTVTGLYKGTYTAVATLAPYTMAPASRSVTVGPNATGANFVADAATATSFSIAGRITQGGLPLPGVLVDAGGVQALTDSSGEYLLSGLPAGDYTVTPSLTDRAFTPASAAVTLGPSSGNTNFTATSTAAVTYAISGVVTVGTSPLAGVAVSVGSSSATTDTNGFYRISGLAPGTYAVTPALANYTFAPTTRSVTLTGADVTAVNFAGTLRLYTISGRILNGSTWTGLAGVLVSVGSRVSVTDANGDFSLTALPSGTYTPSLSLAGFGFSPTPTAVTVGPSVSGLAFTGYQIFRHDFTAGWQLFSLPCVPTTNTLPAIFGSTPTVYSWDPIARTYNSISDPLEQGVGYWARLASATSVAVVGQAATDDSFTIPLTRGWQLLGNPFATPLDWSRTQVAKDGVAVSLTQAAANDWFLPYAWGYTGSTPHLIHDFVAGASPIVQPWEGFWVYAGQAVSVVLYPEAASVSAVRSAAKPAGFAIPISAECGDVVDSGHLLGVAPASLVGSEGLGVVAPPALQGDLSLRFTRAGSDAAYGVDIRSDSAKSWTWTMRVTSRAANQPVTLTFGDMRSLPREFDVLLTDKSAGKTISLRTNTSYVLEAGSEGTTRDLTITVRQVGRGLRIAALTTESTSRGNCSVRYTLSAPAEVTARVLNLAGREVARIAESRTQDAGAQSLDWNGRTSLGSSVASGTYVVELEAVSGAGERTRATAQVTLGL